MKCRCCSDPKDPGCPKDENSPKKYNGITHCKDKKACIEVCIDTVSGRWDNLRRCTIVHEYQHALQCCKGKPLGSCEEIACAEIEAYDISGQCSKTDKDECGGKPGIFKDPDEPRGGYKSKEQCLKDQALKSVRAQPNCRTKDARWMDDQYRKCMQGKSPN